MWTFDTRIPYSDRDCTQQMNTELLTYKDETVTKPLEQCTTNVMGHYVYYKCEKDDEIKEFSWMNSDSCDPQNLNSAAIVLTLKNNECVYEPFGFSHFTSWENVCSELGTCLNL